MMSSKTRADMYGHRARIGYTSPPLTTEVFPYEFYKIVPAGVTLVITTLAITDRGPSEIDQSYALSMKAARAMVAASVDVVVLGGVPINLSRGDGTDMVRALAEELNVKISSSAAAQEKAVKALGCRKVVIAQPYDDSQNERQASYAKRYGCEVLGVAGWGSALNQMGGIPRHAALDMGRALMRAHPQADSILLPSPAWPTAEAIGPLEREFGVSVVSAVQAAIWDALRLVGVNDRIEGYGRLLREF
jgi:maleate isomerase